MLKVNDLSVALGGRDVLRNVSFSVEKGDYLSIVGENGSGKSTLVKAVLGLVNIKSGGVRLEKGVKVGYLAQNMPAESFPASVMEIVLSGCLEKNTVFYTKAQKEKARASLARLNALHLAKKSFQALSGGEKQRVLIARALCAAEDLLVLDEPATGLDPLITEETYRAVSEFNREKGVTVITVSHDIPAAAKFSSHILHIDGGVRFFGTSEEYTLSEIGIHFTGRCCEHV